jgi:hypothetical protein
MAKKDKWIKIIAVFALFWIIIWMIGTWILIIFNWWQKQTNEKNLTEEQYKQIQDMIKAQWWTWVLVNSWVTNTWTIESWKSIKWDTVSTWSLK